MIPSSPSCSRLFAAFLVALALLGAAVAPAAAQADAVRMATFEKVWTTVRDRHWDPELGGLDWEAIHEEFEPRVREATSRIEFRALMNEMIGRLGESHFAVFGPDHGEEGDAPDDPAAGGDAAGGGEDGEPEDAGEEDEDDADLPSGDGFTGFFVRIVDGSLFVTHLFPGGPAEAAGVRIGWELVRYGGRDVSRWLSHRRGEHGEKLNDDIFAVAVVGQRLRGPVGGTVSVEFRLPGEPTTERVPIRVTVPVGDRRVERVVEVVRPTHTAGPIVTKHLELAEPPGRETSMGQLTDMRTYYEARMIGDVGYFSFNLFLDPAVIMPAFGKAMTETFADAAGVVIDIRGNTGGIGFMANGMAGFVIDESGLNLGKMTTRDSTINFLVNPRSETFKGPIAVLTDGASASTSEIFSGGLEDLGRARLFGTRTAGMALPSVIEKLPSGDRFQFAIADCTTPDGHRLEGRGVEPDVEAPHTRESMAHGRDAALDAAIEWIHSDKERKDDP